MEQPKAKKLSDYKAPLYSITKTHLTFELDDQCTRVVTSSQFQRQGQHQQPLQLVGDDLQLQQVALNGDDITAQVQCVAGKLVIDTKLDSFELTVITEINPKANTKLEGLYLSDGAFCTQCEAEGFRRITYFLDRPDVLAIFTVRIEADKARFPYLLSNGNPIERGNLPDNRHFVVWADPYPKPSYLFALVAGDFDCLEDTFTTAQQREVKLQIFVDKGQQEKAHHAMASLKNAMAWDESRFQLEYDLDIYMIVAVDFFNMGAMENKGLNVFNSKFVLADTSTATDDDYDGIESVIGHEYFHNWTGNRITCRDWFQLSLKEGLTVFRDQEFSSDLGSRTVHRINAVKDLRTYQFAEDAGPMAHPIRPQSVIEMNNFYTVTVYEKGAEVIRMIHTLLGEDKFQQGMRCYIERHDGQAVTCDDFVQAMQDASGVDLTQFRRWYAQAGTPVVRVAEHYDETTKQYRLTLSQTTQQTHDGSSKLPFYMPIDIELLDPQGQPMALKISGQPVSSVLHFNEAEQTFVFDDIKAQPVLSILREFSAPVKLEHRLSDDALLHLTRYATNAFSRWDSAQTLIYGQVLRLMNTPETDQPLLSPQFVAGMRDVLNNTQLEPAFVAEFFSLPTESALAEMMTAVDTERLHQARRTLVQQLALQLAGDWEACYQYCTRAEQQGEQVRGYRRLKNTCLGFLAWLPEAFDTWVLPQYDGAANMTDQMGALRAINPLPLPQRDVLMQRFEQQWLQNPLVMDKWFALQATTSTSDTLVRLQSLMNHQAFSFNNPNRVRALIGSFVMHNPYVFHAKDGSGYQFLKEQLTQLNTVNPQVAARLITPLTQWKAQPPVKQDQMKRCLEELLALKNLSKDLYEKVSKSLQQ
ncbi:MAG: aminopeptidase N [Shewanellaceae bacterium]|nr:aminopeptidase N [Shewanellaceae bacterium]